MLEARGLTKRYGGLLAVDRVTFHLDRGEILGYLGPNGSGKSTTVNMVVGLIEPSAGSLHLNGTSLAAEPAAYKRRVGYVPEEPYLDTHLTAPEYLTLVGSLRGIPAEPLARKIGHLLGLFSPAAAASRSVDSLNAGARAGSRRSRRCSSSRPAGTTSPAPPGRSSM